MEKLFGIDKNIFMQLFKRKKDCLIANLCDSINKDGDITTINWYIKKNTIVAYNKKQSQDRLEMAIKDHFNVIKYQEENKIKMQDILNLFDDEEETRENKKGFLSIFKSDKDSGKLSIAK